MERHHGKDRIPNRCASPGRRHAHISPPTDRLLNDVLISPPHRQRPPSSPYDEKGETTILGITQCLLPLPPDVLKPPPILAGVVPANHDLPGAF